MSRLEELKPNAAVRGILPEALATVVSVQWFGSEALELTYKTAAGKVANELLYRHDEPRLEVVTQGRPWSFDGDGREFRLVSEAHRIRLAHLFDPVLAVHTSVVEPLPHQITAVYDVMLPRQPLRFLLADDPGAGKTIMAGLLMKELLARGDLHRCLVVCPGSLAEQWQDELYRRFHLPFEILTNDKLEAARTGNWFLETNLVIARLDKLSRNEDVQEMLKAPDCRWDLIVCDEAHKMSASLFGGEITYTKRYRLGQLLSTLTRHFLLMTATPHNGKEEVFQLFMPLLDGDRFEGRFRDGVHATDVSDLMRRMVKENLLKFDATPLFPERIAYTVPYKLSDAEARLYKEVTDYVRDEFNRAEALQNNKRAGTVGFALTILQRRLASSPEAIYQSFRRRKERLEKKLREMELLQRGAEVATAIASTVPTLDEEDVEDLEEAPDNEVQAAEEENYDLPWNPNRIEQRFGRIHRIGQTEVCHLWNLVAEETREGDVYRTLLEKLEQARQALGGPVFDVLGKLQFEGKPLRDLLIEAIRYGDRPEVRARKLDLIAKTEAAVQDRLTKEISYWDHRAEQLKLQEQAGKPNARLNSDEARKRADGLQARLQKRMEELKLEKQIAPLPPVVMGGVLVIPTGLLRQVKGQGEGGEVAVSGADNEAAAAKARSIIMQVERELGFVPTDRETEKLGYDIESRIPGTGKLRFIEVKGRVSGAATITVTKNEILYSLNKPDDFILGIVEFMGDLPATTGATGAAQAGTHRVHYVRRPFQREPDFGVTSVSYNFAELLARAEVPK